jgi:hypothetical protein
MYRDVFSAAISVAIKVHPCTLSQPILGCDGRKRGFEWNFTQVQFELTIHERAGGLRGDGGA